VLAPEFTPDRAACRAAGAVSLRSTPPFTPFAGAHIRSGPPSYDAEGGTGSGHPATSALTGSISGIDREGGVPSLGQKGETTNTQTTDFRDLGLLCGWSPLETTHRPRQRPFSRTVTPSNRGPSTLGPVFPDGHSFQPGTVHAGTCFPGRSLLPTGDRPRWDLFSRTVAFQNKGPSTLEAISPAGQRLERGGVVQGDMPPPARGVPAKRMALCESRRRGSPVPPHPATRGACEANGLVRIAQAGVAGADPARDVKKGVQPMMPRRPPRDAGKTGTTAAQRPGAAATARPGCGELNPKGSPPRPAVAGASQGPFKAHL